MPLKQKKILPVYLWALSYFKPYFKTLILLVVCSLIINGIQLSIPKGVQHFIDVILPNEDYTLFKWLMIGISLGVLFMFSVMAVENLLRRSLQEQAARDIQYDIFKHLRVLGFSYFERRPIGESLSFMNSEVTSLQNLYRSLFPGMIRTMIFSIVSITLMVMVSVQLTLIMIPCLVLYYLVGPYFERRASLLSTENTENRIAFNQKAYESISAISELRAHNAVKWDESRLMDKLQRFVNTRVKMLWIAYWRGTVRRLSYYIGGIAVIIYGIHLVQNGSLSVGGMTAFLLYYFQVMQTVTVVITLITEQKVLMVQAEKIYQFIKTKPEVQEPSQPVLLQAPKGEISFCDVSYHYQGGPKVLQHFNLHISAGQRVALVGASGNGKSTLLKLLVRFYDPQKGRILMDGVDISKLSFVQLRETMGYVFQETYLFGASVRENILFGRPGASEQDVENAAKSAFAHDFIMELPQGYDTLLGERGIRLSGGQKQRISIARMVIKNPSIILLDEATSALDNVSEKEVQGALNKLLDGKTIITVAHRLSTIQNYDSIIVIHDGRIVEKGNHQELMDNKSFYYQLGAAEAERGVS